MGLVVGVALGLSGALIQALTRNPLADPGILGVHAGASFAVTVAVGVLGVRDVQGYMWFAFAGALVVTLMVLALGSTRQGQSPVVMVLAGVCVGAVLGGARRGAPVDQPGRLRCDAVLERRFDRGPPTRGGVADPAVLRGGTSSWPSRCRVRSTPWLWVTSWPVAQGVRLVRTARTFGDRPHPACRWRHRDRRTHRVRRPDGAARRRAGSSAHTSGWIFAYSVLLAPSLLLASDILGRVVMRPEVRSPSASSPPSSARLSSSRWSRQKKASGLKSAGFSSRSRFAHTSLDGRGSSERVDFGRRVLVLRRWRVAVRLEWRSVMVCTMLALAVACMAVLALMTGSYQLSLGQVVSRA